MSAATLRPEERIGLVVALAAHAGLFAWLAWTKPAPPPPPPERMTVSLSEDVGLSATSPTPAPEAAPDKAPELGEAPPKPEPVVKVEPPKPQPQPKAPVKPATTVQKKPPITPAKAPPKPQKPPARPSGGSSFDNAFKPGTPGAQGKNPSQNASAATLGPQQQSALRAAIMRQIKPHWSAPQGIDAELLVSTVRFRLDQNGRLIGEPELVSQKTTVGNQPQARRHFEQAVRAIKLAQPFILPPDFYPYWQTVTSTFDKRLSQ